MIGAWIRELRQDRSGVTVVEFALVAPFMLLFMLGLMEGGRAVWTYQSLQETAFASARCMVIGLSPCDTIADTKSYAVAKGAKSNITIPLSAITAESDVTCDGVSGQGRVQIVLPYDTALSGFGVMDVTSLTVSACFPIPPDA